MVRIKSWNKVSETEWVSDNNEVSIRIINSIEKRGYQLIVRGLGRQYVSPTLLTKREILNYAMMYMRNNTGHVSRHSHITNQFIISLDFDGVLAHGLNAKRKYAKKWFGLNLSLEQTKKDGFNKLVNSNRKLRRQGINYRSLMDPLNEQHIMEYEIPPGCIQALQRMVNTGFKFVVVTSRNDHDYPYAVKFIKHHFGNLISTVYNTRNTSKHHYIKKLHVRIHLDDDIKKLMDLNGLPVHKVFYSQPENHHVYFNHSDVVTVNNWERFFYYCHYVKDLQEKVCFEFGIDNKWSNIDKIFKLEHKVK